MTAKREPEWTKRCRRLWTKYSDDVRAHEKDEKLVLRKGVPVFSKGKIPRNHPCPCGSFAKYKHCCLRQTLSG